RFMQMLLLAAVGAVIASTSRIPLSFAGALRIAVMGLTPVILLTTVYDLVMPSHSFWWIWWMACMAIAVACTSFGVLACRTVAEPESF
ncbi:MAG: DUF1189 domain-containing protein, partial [Planctomycetales bacterium]